MQQILTRITANVLEPTDQSTYALWHYQLNSRMAQVPEVPGQQPHNMALQQPNSSQMLTNLLERSQELHNTPDDAMSFVMSYGEG